MKKTITLSLLSLMIVLMIGCESSGITALKVYLQQKRIPEAIREGEAAIAMEPANPETYYWTSVAYIEKQDYIMACSYLEKALAKGLTLDDLNKRSKGEGLDNWDYHQVYLAGGVQALGAEDYEEAALYLSRSIELLPEDATPYAILGSVYRELVQYDSMMTYYNIALEKDPTNFPALRNIGLYYLNTEKDYQEAANTFEKVLSVHDTSATIWYYQGLTFIQLANEYGSEGDLDQRKIYLEKSDNSFSKAYELNPHSRVSEIALYRGITLVSLEKYDLAVPVLTEGLENIPADDPNRDKILYNLGLSYNQLERYEKAVEVLTEAIEINPQSRYYNLRADCYNHLGMKDKAQEDLQKATGI